MLTYIYADLNECRELSRLFKLLDIKKEDLFFVPCNIDNSEFCSSDCLDNVDPNLDYCIVVDKQHLHHLDSSLKLMILDSFDELHSYFYVAIILLKLTRFENFATFKIYANNLLYLFLSRLLTFKCNLNLTIISIDEKFQKSKNEFRDILEDFIIFPSFICLSKQHSYSSVFFNSLNENSIVLCTSDPRSINDILMCYFASFDDASFNTKVHILFNREDYITNIKNIVNDLNIRNLYFFKQYQNSDKTLNSKELIRSRIKNISNGFMIPECVSKLRDGNRNLICVYDEYFNIKVVDKVDGVNIVFKGVNNVVLISNTFKLMNSTFELQDNNIIFIKKTFVLLPNVLNIFNFYRPNSKVLIDESFSCIGCNISVSSGDIYIGRDCMFSFDVDILANDGHSIFSSDGSCYNFDDCLYIGNHVWISSHSRILKNSLVDDNSIVGNSSVLSGIFQEKGVIIAGNPANIVRHNITWSRHNPIVFSRKEI